MHQQLKQRLTSMDTLGRLISGRGSTGPLLRHGRLSQDWGWLQVVLGLPLTLVMLLAIMLLALPDLLRKNPKRWERYGER
jgi:hypothetical protein